MKLNDAVNLLNNHKGSHSYDCYVPSMKRKVPFRPLTVAEFKTVSKMSIDDDDFTVALNAMIITLSLEELKLEDLTEIDKIRILMDIRRSNELGDDTYRITCSKCDTEYLHELDMAKIMESFDDAPEPKTIEREIGDSKFKFVIDMPSLELTGKYNKFMKILSETMKEENYEQDKIRAVELHMVKYSCLLFVKRIFINDEEVEGFESCSFDERNKFIDLLPAALLDELMKVIVDEPKYDLMSHLAVPIECPSCKDKQTLHVNIADFFQI